MPTRVLHVSDLHFGRNDKPESIEALGRLVEESRPELVIASGDLTHRGLRSQHERAAAFLRGLELPLVTIPGNHDIPYTFPKRFTRPWQEFERLWETTEPVYRSGHARRRRAELGAALAAPVGAAARRAGARGRRDVRRHPDRTFRIVTFHHHLLGAPWRSRKKPVAKRNRVLAGLVEAGADLILAGHIHQSTIAERREFELVDAGRRARRRRLDRAGLRPAAAEPPRRGARPARLRDRGDDAAHPHLHLARGRLGAHGRADVPARP